MTQQLFDTVKNAVDKADVYGLLNMGCPPYEYDLESYAISENINPLMNVFEVRNVVEKVFFDFLNIDIDGTEIAMDIVSAF